MSENPSNTAAPTPLSPEIAALIAAVVGRTRLRRAEREDIARELTAHFRDGLDAAKSPAQLVSAFGDVNHAAAQLRAGAIAKRSPFDRALRTARIAAGWCIVAVGVPYAASIGYLYLNAPVISFDVTARLNALLPQVAPSERGWPLFKQGMIALADPVDPAAAEWQPKQYKQIGDRGEFPFPGDAEWARDGEVLRERSAGFDLLAQAAARPALGYMPATHTREEDAELIFWDRTAKPVETAFPAFAMLLPQLALQRTSARLLGFDSLHAIEEGDGARFVRDISALLGSATQAEEGKYIISQLVGSAIRSMAFDRITMALEWRPDALTDEQLAHLAQLLRAIPASAYEVELEAELLGLMDCIQRTYSDDGNGDGWFNPVYGALLLDELTAMTSTTDSSSDPSIDSTIGVLLSPLGAAVVASRKETVALCTSLMEKCEQQSQLPLWQQDYSFESEFESMVHESALAQQRWFLPRLLLPALSSAATGRRRAETHAIAAQVAIACVQYRRAHAGAWPTKLDDLVPTLLATTPRDPTTGEPVLFESVNGMPQISSAAVSSVRNSDGHKRWIWFSGDDQLKRWRTNR